MDQDKLRIAFATTEYVTEKCFDGGLGHYTHRVATSLAKMGHEIHVVAFSEINRAEFQHEKVSIHRVMPSRALPNINRLTRYRVANTTHLLDMSMQVYRKLKEINKRDPLDLIQIPNSVVCGLLLPIFLKIPYVLLAASYKRSFHNFDGLELNLDLRIVQWLERLQLRRSRNIFTSSHRLQKILKDQAGLDNVRVIPHSAHLQTESWDQSAYDQHFKDKKYLLFYGRFGLRKGFHILAQALPRVLERCSDAHVVLVGRDRATSLAPSMADYVRSLCGDFAERVTVSGQLPMNQLYPIIFRAHLVVLPSLMDNLPNACLESMTLGRPVIGTDGASFEELIEDEKSGFLVEPNNVKALAEKIIHAWAHPRLDEIGRSAQKRMADFSPEKNLNELLDYYHEVLADRFVCDQLETGAPA